MNEHTQRTGFAAINSPDELPLYARGRRAVQMVHEALDKLSDLSMSELEAVARFLQDRVERQEKLEADIAAMSSEQLTDALEKVLAEVKARRAALAAEKKAEPARESVTAQTLTASLVALAESLRGAE